MWVFNNAEKVIKSLGVVKEVPLTYNARRCRIGFRKAGYSNEEEITNWDYEKKELIQHQEIITDMLVGWRKRLSDQKQKLVDEKAKEKPWERWIEDYNDDIKESEEKIEQLIKYCSPNFKKEVGKNFNEFTQATKEKTDWWNIKKTIEYSLARDKWNIGFIDLLLQVRFQALSSTFFRNEWDIEEGENIFVEVKPEIKSIGEVMRQINFYRDYLGKDAKVLLVTKTKGLKEVFESQGVFLYEYVDEDDVQTKLEEGVGND